MSGGIFLVQGQGQLGRLSEAPYEAEAVLQDLLANYSDLLAGEQIDPDNPRRWLLVKRELGIPSDDGSGNRWSVDHLFLDQDAIPTLVEVKRSTDSRIRREVVGQMLDYAANGIVYWPSEAIRSQFEASQAAKDVDPTETVSAFLEGGDVEAFWLQVRHNLQAGRVRMVFVADVIPQELRRIVEFLNGQMDPAEVIAIEIRQFKGGGLTALVPQVVGQTAASRQVKSTTGASSRQWDEASFFHDLEDRNGPAVAEVGRDLLDWAKSRNLEVVWGKGRSAGSFNPRLIHDGQPVRTIGVWTSGVLEFLFQYLSQNRTPTGVHPFSTEASRTDLLNRLNAIDGVALSHTAINKRPSIPLETFVDLDRRSHLLTVLNWLVDQLTGTEQVG